MGIGQSHREGHTVTELIYRLGLMLEVCALFGLHPDAEQDMDHGDVAFGGGGSADTSAVPVASATGETAQF